MLRRVDHEPTGVSVFWHDGAACCVPRIQGLHSDWGVVGNVTTVVNTPPRVDPDSFGPHKAPDLVNDYVLRRLAISRAYAEGRKPTVL